MKKRTKQPEFIIVTGENKKMVARELKMKKGYLLITEQGHHSFPDHVIDVSISLFYGPTIRNESVHTDYEPQRPISKEKDREYVLQQKPELSDNSTWDSAHDFFEQLVIDDCYWFQIQRQTTFLQGLWGEDGVTLYIPRRTSLKAAFRYALTFMTEKVNAALKKDGSEFEFKKHHINKMVAYALKDLKTGAILMHNTKAGRDADMLVGFG